ncbi:MAG: ABC transporter ATP-binding protein [Anaerolineales bacterium]|nr:ABC transporter ATP-binding protein [Anaerolineales bacterium]
MRQADEKPKVTWGLLRRVLSYSNPYRWQIAGMLLMILFTTGLTLLTPLIMRDMIDRTIPSKDTARLMWLALALLAIPALRGVVGVAQRRLNAGVGEGVIYDLRVALFARLQRMSLRFFTHTKIGELMSRLNNDVIGAQNAISNTIVNIITNLIETTALLGVMLTLEWRLTVVGILILPLFILVARRMGARLREIARQGMDANAAMNAMMNETLSIGGALLVKLFGRKDTEVARFQERAAHVRDIGVRRALIGTAFFAIVGLISAVGTALVYGIGGYLVIRDVFTIGTIVAFTAYLGTLYGALQGLANAPVEFATSMVSFERVFEVIDLPQDIAEKPGAVTLQHVCGELVFEQVTFRYEVAEQSLLSEVRRFGRMDDVTAVLSGGKEGHDRVVQERSEVEEPRSQARLNALEEISFRVAPGQLAALVGPSGAGKTTLTYLIPRLYDPVQGRILLDGHDLRDVNLNSLAAQIGMVTQETHLFHDTIHTNLLYAFLDATQEQIEAACRAANIHDFIAGLPDGYNTVVGERGYRLSGGEKQRLALARVILKDPHILVLDEATSHLDSESEALIQDALKHVMAGRTSIVIAHRLSTILAADLILVFDRGRIVERGTHQELLAQGGLYAQLYETQFKREREVA